jgi:hypothetical protein
MSLSTTESEEADDVETPDSGARMPHRRSIAQFSKQRMLIYLNEQHARPIAGFFLSS